MKYISQFLLFWRRFLIGDDWALAAAVLWGLALVQSFSYYLINAYIMLPLVVVIAVAWSVLKQLAARPIILYPILPLILFVDLLPTAVFRLHSQTASVATLVIPVLLCAAIGAVVSLALYPLYKVRPFTATIAAIAGSLVLMRYVQPHLLYWSQTVISPHNGLLAAAALGSLFIVFTVYYVLHVQSHKLRGRALRS
jgi:hypothetical protein